MQRLIGDDLALTQEFLAQMIGVQRSGVNAIAQELQKLEMISPIREAKFAFSTDRGSNSWHANVTPPSMRTTRRSSILKEPRQICPADKPESVTRQTLALRSYSFSRWTASSAS